MEYNIYLKEKEESHDNLLFTVNDDSINNGNFENELNNLGLLLEEVKIVSSYKNIEDLNKQREIEVNNLVIEIDAVSLDGDEESQTRMSRAISVLSEGETIIWIDASGVPQELTKEQLQAFLKVAGKKQTEIFIKYSELKGEL